MGTQGKRSNIVALAYHQVMCPLAKAGDPVSWILFAFFVALVIIAITLQFTGPHEKDSLYSTYFLAFWYGAWGLFVLATIGPIFTIAQVRKEAPLGILIGLGVLHLITFIAISVVVLLQYNRPEAVTGLMAAFVGAIMVGIGWVVQHQSSARASRRSHTFSILMQSRLSKEFQEQVKKRCDYYYSGVVVRPEDAPLISMAGLAERERMINDALERDIGQSKEEAKEAIRARYETELQLVRRKHESLQGVKYLLNFYEFMSAGICQRELDEALLRASVGSIVKGLYEDTRHLRSYLRDVQPKVFIEIDQVMDKHWA